MRMLTPTQTRQPAGPALIDWSNPITRGLVEGINGRTGTYLTRPALLVPAASNSRGTKPTAQGVAYYNFGDNSPLLPRAISGSRTLMVLAVAPGLTTGGVLPATCGHVVNSLTHHITDTDGTTAGLIRGHFYVNGGFRVFGGSFTVPTGEIYSAVNRHIQGVGQSLWVNGALDPVTGAFTGAALDNAAYGAYGTNNTDRYVLLSLLWNRALTDAEVVSISRNPWQLFEPDRRIWSYEAAAGGTLFNQSVFGSTTLQSSLVRLTGKRVIAETTISATIKKDTTKGALLGSIAATGSLAIGGTLSYLATGSITVAGALSDAVTYLRSYASTITPTGSPFRLINKVISSSLTLAGSAYKGMYKSIASSITALGSLNSFKFTPSGGNLITSGIRFLKKYIGRR